MIRCAAKRSTLTAVLLICEITRSYKSILVCALKKLILDKLLLELVTRRRETLNEEAENNANNVWATRRGAQRLRLYATEFQGARKSRVVRGKLSTNATSGDVAFHIFIALVATVC